MADSSTNLSKLDANQIFRLSYDDQNNRLRVGAEVTATVGDVDVVIDSAAGDNIAIADPSGTNYLLPNSDGSINVNITDIAIDQATDSIAIGDGTNLIDVNPDGSLNVVITNSGLTTRNLFNEISSVATGVTSTIISHLAISETKLLKVAIGGTNVAAYSVYIAGVLVAKKYTFYTTLNEDFDFTNGMPIQIGDLIEVKVLHSRPDPGDFNCNMLVEN